MPTRDIDLRRLREAPWNPNAMDGPSLAKLRKSIQRFGLVVPLVVRRLEDNFEVLSGNQRLSVLRDLAVQRVPCTVVKLNDASAMLLTQTLNHLHGVDDPGLEAELLRQVVAQLGEGAVLDVLPEAKARLRALTSVDTQDLAGYLDGWEAKQRVRLRHFTAQLSGDQHAVVEQVLDEFKGVEPAGEHANQHGHALYRLCRAYLTLRGAA